MNWQDNLALQRTRNINLRHHLIFVKFFGNEDFRLVDYWQKQVLEFTWKTSRSAHEYGVGIKEKCLAISNRVFRDYRRTSVSSLTAKFDWEGCGLFANRCLFRLAISYTILLGCLWSV